MRNNKLQAKAWKKSDTVLDKENSLDGNYYLNDPNILEFNWKINKLERDWAVQKRETANMSRIQGNNSHLFYSKYGPALSSRKEGKNE